MCPLNRPLISELHIEVENMDEPDNNYEDEDEDGELRSSNDLFPPHYRIVDLLGFRL